MHIETSRFGTIEVPESAVLTFPAGIIGFPASTRYAILDHDREAPFKWLQSLDDGRLAFVIMDPALFKPDYRPTVTPVLRAHLGVGERDEVAWFVILTIPVHQTGPVTANLQGPVAVNLRTKLAAQVILSEAYPIRFPITEHAGGASAAQASAGPEKEPAPNKRAPVPVHASRETCSVAKAR